MSEESKREKNERLKPREKYFIRTTKGNCRKETAKRFKFREKKKKEKEIVPDSLYKKKTQEATQKKEEVQLS